MAAEFDRLGQSSREGSFESLLASHFLASQFLVTVEVRIRTPESTDAPQAPVMGTERRS